MNSNVLNPFYKTKTISLSSKFHLCFTQLQHLTFKLFYAGMPNPRLMLPQEIALFLNISNNTTTQSHCFLPKYGLIIVVVVVIWSGTQTQSGPAQIKARAEGLSFCHPGLLPRLDAGSGGVKPTSSCVIQNLQTSCSSWCMM